MKLRNQMKRTYISPVVQPTEVLFEQALLVTTTRITMTVDELENVNDDPADDQAGGDMYFEF